MAERANDSIIGDDSNVTAAFKQSSDRGSSRLGFKGEPFDSLIHLIKIVVNFAAYFFKQLKLGFVAWAAWSFR